MLNRLVACCSARQALNELLIPGSLRDDGADPTKAKGNGVIRAMDVFDHTQEIYPGSKITHFKELHKKTGIAYEDMVSLISRAAVVASGRL